MHFFEKKIYPEDFTCIIDPQDGRGGLYIGNLQAAQNKKTLQKYQIKAILTAAREVEINHPKQQIPFCLHVPAEDHQAFDISRYFHQASNFINDCLQRTNIIVHCLAGVSRSVSLVIAYFIKHKRLSFAEAYDLIKSRRRVIHPNDGFVKQLKKFQKDNSDKNKVISFSAKQKLSQTNKKQWREPVSPFFQIKQFEVKSRSTEIETIKSKYQQNKKITEKLITNPQAVGSSENNCCIDAPDSNRTRFKKAYSMSVHSETINNYEQSSTKIVQKKLAGKIRSNFDKIPLNSIQNIAQIRINAAGQQISRKIEQIRKKYQRPPVDSQKNQNNQIKKLSLSKEKNVRTRMSNNYICNKSNLQFENMAFDSFNSKLDQFNSSFLKRLKKQELKY